MPPPATPRAKRPRLSARAQRQKQRRRDFKALTKPTFNIMPLIRVVARIHQPVLSLNAFMDLALLYLRFKQRPPTPQFLRLHLGRFSTPTS